MSHVRYPFLALYVQNLFINIFISPRDIINTKINILAHKMYRNIAYHQAQLTIADHSTLSCSVASRHIISSSFFPKNLTSSLIGFPNQS